MGCRWDTQSTHGAVNSIDLDVASATVASRAAPLLVTPRSRTRNSLLRNIGCQCSSDAHVVHALSEWSSGRSYSKSAAGLAPRWERITSCHTDRRSTCTAVSRCVSAYASQGSMTGRETDQHCGSAWPGAVLTSEKDFPQFGCSQW